MEEKDLYIYRLWVRTVRAVIITATPLHPELISISSGIMHLILKISL